MNKIMPSLAVSLTLFAFAFLLYSISLWDTAWASPQLTYTFLILGSTHLVFRVLVYSLLLRHIQSGRVRYSLSKTLTLLHLFIASLFILRIWLPDSTTLLAAYGFVAAAVAFSIQDLFKNFIGGAVILVRSLYKVGDRIQIGETYGDIIDIGVLYTTLLEIRAWVAGDQSTGRIIRVPNGKVITSDVINYTADHSFIWDELHIPVTHESDWRRAEQILTDIINELTNELNASAMEEIRHLQSKYFLTNENVDPHVYMVITDNWISLYARYIVSARERRNVQDKIMRQIKDRFDNEPGIIIASETTTITVSK
ncbi:MAG: mechanosensitive ion channel [Candidatus Paceibacterota bacterium]